MGQIAGDNVEMAKSVSGKFNSVIWVVRACYVSALAIIAVICLKFYFEQEIENNKVNSIQAFWQQLNKTNYAADAFQKRALKLSTELNPSNMDREQFAKYQSMATYLSVLSELRRKTAVEVLKLKQKWYSLPPELIDDIKNSSRLMKGDKPLRHFDTLGNFQRIKKINSEANLYWYCREMVSVFENQTQLNTRHIVSKIEESQHNNFHNQGTKLQQFLLITIACLAIIGLFVFLPLDLFIQKMLFNIAEKTRVAEEQRKMASLADRAKSEFLANMSHEIRTPMNGVMGMAELLIKTKLDDKQKTFADIIVKSGNALLTIINDILDFSKIDAGQMELDPAPFSLTEAIEDVAALVSTKIQEKDLELVVHISPEMPTSLVGDVGRIRQIVTNLVGNAVKFTEAGHVLVEAKCELNENKAKIRVCIEDTGIGIREDKLNKIFEKFSQVDESATRKHEGTGLGLAIASSLVHLMGGKIDVESTEGVGSKFWFEITLPVHGEQKPKQTVDQVLSGARVLIVDDNCVNRRILLENLESWGFDAAAASSGQEALAVMDALAKQELVLDCLVLDYQMPNISGADLAHQIRDDVRYANTPIVMLTSVEQMDDGKHFSALDIQGHLLKPVRSSMLLDTISRAVLASRSSDTEDSAGIEMARTIGLISATPTDEVDSSTVEADPVKPNATVSADEGQITEAELDYKPAFNLDDIDIPPAEQEPVRLDVLIAEDNEVNQIVFSQILQTMNLKFQIVENGRLAIDTYLRTRPAVICMDVSMPVLNGLEATQEIRRIEEQVDRHTPIIGVTAHAITGDRDKCIEAGMDDYLSKPVSPKLLEEKILKWLKREDDEAISA